MDETSCGYLDAAMDRDQELVKAALRGDFTAFDALVELNWRKVASVSRVFLRDPNDVDDAVQETFVKAFENLHSFRGTASLQTWLLRIAVNCCKNRRRSFWSRWVVLGGDGDERKSDGSASLVGSIGAGGLDRSGGMDAFDASIQSKAVRGAVARLPEKYRLPIQMHYFEEMKGAEIAAVLGWNESTVWSRIYAGCKMLRKSLAGWSG